MNPRLPSSKKWTAFPKEYISQIETVFKEGFEAPLKGRNLVVDGRIYKEEIMLRVGVHQKNKLSQANFEISMNYQADISNDFVEKIYNCIDAAGSMMLEWFDSDGEAEFPRTWKETDFENQKVFLQFTTDNTELESKADALLGLDQKSLIVDEAEASEDALDAADERIEIDEDSVPPKGKLH